MPRLTYDPSLSSLAARAAISSRLHAMSASQSVRRGVVGRSSVRRPGARGDLLDLLVRGLLRRELHDPLDVDARRVDLGRVELAGLHEVLDLRDGDPAAHRGERV